MKDKKVTVSKVIQFSAVLTQEMYEKDLNLVPSNDEIGQGFLDMIESELSSEMSVGNANVFVTNFHGDFEDLSYDIYKVNGVQNDR